MNQNKLLIENANICSLRKSKVCNSKDIKRSLEGFESLKTVEPDGKTLVCLRFESQSSDDRLVRIYECKMKNIFF